MDSTTSVDQGLNLPFLERSGLLYLTSNISTELAVNAFSKTPSLSVQNKKSAFILMKSVENFCNVHGTDNIGFLTLTFADHVVLHKEGSRRLNSFLSHVVKPRYGSYIGVAERQKSHRLHYHLLVNVGFDIRTGFDHYAVKNRDLNGLKKKRDNSSVSPGLRKEWHFLKETVPKYNFGRTELHPVKSNAVGLSKYISKYLVKGLEVRCEDDRNARLVRYSKDARVGNTRFSFLSEGGYQWRKKCEVFCEIVQSRHPNEIIRDKSDMDRVIGKRWEYLNRSFIISLPEQA
jgi:hypothetical protein